MGVPKRKHSKARRDKRRAHYSIKVKSLSVCPRCGEKKLPHRVCPHCGFYKQRQVLEIED